MPPKKSSQDVGLKGSKGKETNRRRGNSDHIVSRQTFDRPNVNNRGVGPSPLSRTPGVRPSSTLDVQREPQDDYTPFFSPQTQSYPNVAYLPPTDALLRPANGNWGLSAFADAFPSDPSLHMDLGDDQIPTDGNMGPHMDEDAQVDELFESSDHEEEEEGMIWRRRQLQSISRADHLLELTVLMRKILFQILAFPLQKNGLLFLHVE